MGMFSPQLYYNWYPSYNIMVWSSFNLHGQIVYRAVFSSILRKTEYTV